MAIGSVFQLCLSRSRKAACASTLALPKAWNMAGRIRLRGNALAWKRRSPGNDVAVHGPSDVGSTERIPCSKVALVQLVSHEVPVCCLQSLSQVPCPQFAASSSLPPTSLSQFPAPTSLSPVPYPKFPPHFAAPTT